MPTITPGTLLGAPKLQLFDNDGDPVAGGFLFTYEAGSSTPATTYSDSDLTVANTNPVELDAAGRATVYLQPGIAYKFVLQDEDLVTIWTQDNVSDLSTLLFGFLISTEGSKGVTDGYDVDDDDTLITVNSSATLPTDVDLPAVTARFRPITIKNIGSNPVRINRAGSDTIEDSLTSIELPPALTPNFPTVTLIPDGVDNWWVFNGWKEQDIRVATVTLTNAQMLALPTTPITLLAAQGSGIWARIVRLVLDPDFSAGAYTNIDATISYIRAEYDGATNEPGTQPILTDSGAGVNQLPTFLGTTPTIVDLAPAQVPSVATYGPLPELMTRANIVNVPVVILASNNAAGNFTGGNAANAMVARLYYVLETV